LSSWSLRRAVLKSISWRILAFSITFTVLYITTGNPVYVIPTSITIEVLKFLAYIVHEYLWRSRG